MLDTQNIYDLIVSAESEGLRRFALLSQQAAAGTLFKEKRAICLLE